MSPRVGVTLSGRYRLQRLIATGGMGQVWEAVDSRLGRRVAVKVLKAEFSSDPEFVERFRAEARTVAMLNHPGIASVYDYGETDMDGEGRTAYLVMELINGEPLNSVIKRTGRLSLRGEDFPQLRNGAYVATVTSSEDELELDGLTEVYDRTPITDDITRYMTTGHYFYLLNKGNAVNFLHGASVGPFIFLVQAEILAAVAKLARRMVEPGLHEIPDARAMIAATWLNYFNR